MTIREQIERLSWEPPWSLLDEARAAELVAELNRELGETHPLRTHSFQAIAARADSDDVLFLTTSQAGIVLAVIHLTWTGIPEQDERFPTIQFFESVVEFYEQALQPDILEYNCQE